MYFPFENARYNGNLKLFQEKSQYIVFNDNKLILKVDRYNHKAADSNYDLTTNHMRKRPGLVSWNSELLLFLPFTFSVGVLKDSLITARKVAKKHVKVLEILRFSSFASPSRKLRKLRKTPQSTRKEGEKPKKFVKVLPNQKKRWKLCLWNTKRYR